MDSRAECAGWARTLARPPVMSHVGNHYIVTCNITSYMVNNDMTT